MDELFKRARISGQSEARLLADFFDSDDFRREDGSYDMDLIISSIVQVRDWTVTFAKEALKHAS